jgi:hypothetical protein
VFYFSSAKAGSNSTPRNPRVAVQPGHVPDSGLGHQAASIPVVPEANPGLVLIPVAGLLLLSARRLWPGGAVEFTPVFNLVTPVFAPERRPIPAESWSAAQVLELYRCRWQIELAFKRLKSLLQLGQLPKQDPASARAWLQLKLLLALLIERLCHQARFFSRLGLPP